MEKTKKIKMFISSSILLLFFFLSNTALAATLSFTPAAGTHEKDSIFSVGVYVGSLDKSMNAVAATVVFPTDKLQVVSVSKSNSIIDFWAQEPSFSNTGGTVKFEGVILPPGFQGGNGRLLTISFKGKALGVADVKVTGAQVLANDGVGTPIASSVTGAVFTIKAAETPPPQVIDLDKEVPVEVSEPIIEPEIACEADSIIYSPTHPGQIWRKDNTAIFSWDIADDIVASRIAFDKNPNTEPDTLSKPAIVEKKYENIDDGVWYFHLALQDNDGWLKTEHFKIQIDQTAPVISLEEVPRVDKTDPNVIVNLSIVDNASCVKSFSMSIDGNETEYKKLKNGNYSLGVMDPGHHEVLVEVVDRAGNQTEAYLDIEIVPIDEPIVKEYESPVSNYKEIFVKGESMENTDISVKVINRFSKAEFIEEFNSSTKEWRWEPETKMKSGNYILSFKATDSRGASSNWTEPIRIKVGSGINVGEVMGSIPPYVIMIVLTIIGVVIVLIMTRLHKNRAIRDRQKGKRLTQKKTPLI